MRIVETEVYQFEELSATAKEVAIENHRDTNTHDGWWEPIYEGFTEEANKAGFHVGSIYFSGFWSQGDGAMFEYTTLEDTLLNEFIDGLDLSPMRKNWLRTQTYAEALGKHSGHYKISFESNCGYNYANVNFYNWIGSFEDQFEEFVIAKYKTLCRDLYSQLSKYYDELTTDEAVADTLRNNDWWEFNEDGNNFQ